MIQTLQLSKSYGDVRAVNDVSIRIEDREIFGLIGTNGAGKSTLLRMMAGVMRQDSGQILYDGRPVYDDADVKKDLFFIPNDFYYFSNASGAEMNDYFSHIYPMYDKERFERMMKDFALDPKRRVREYSKGMKKQLSLVLALSARTRYILCDETFDGLDPVVRQAVKSLFARDMEDRGLTPVLTSHNLREIEDICDHIGLLHQGGVLLSEDLVDMKSNIQKIQVVFTDEQARAQTLEKLSVMNAEKRGRLETITIRAARDAAEQAFAAADTIFYEILPLSLEEIFISETEVAGYDIKRFILD